MTGAELKAFVAELGTRLKVVGAQNSDLNALVSSAAGIADLLDKPAKSVTEAQWSLAVAQFEQARSSILSLLARATAGALAELPMLRDSLGSPEAIARSGLHAAFELGPVRVAVSSGVFYADGPTLDNGIVAPPIAIGPSGLGALEATITSPLGGGGPAMPGGGSLARLTTNLGTESWGGRLELPLPPVQVSAAAILSMEGTNPSFLAVLGIAFIPPIQLSFGFSLDQVGGIVGVNRTMQVDVLRAAVRTGAAGDALFQVRPPANPLDFARTLDGLFPRRYGSHVLGPSLKLSWLSFGTEGSLVSLDLAVIAEIPAGRVAILGTARMGLPSAPALINLRLDMLGLVDPLERLVSIDASLVDSHVLGTFEIYGDAALRLSWGSQPYVVATVGGFFPGFDPKPAKLPALRRVGMSQSVPGSGISLRVEGYFAVTANCVQMGGRIEASINRIIAAHGFIEADAIVQFRPFRFHAQVAAGFSISVEDFSFASVQLTGKITGPGPMVVHGSLSISVFLFEISWDQTFTLGSGQGDPVPLPAPLLDILAGELGKHENVKTADGTDPDVALAPQAPTGEFALVPPTGKLQVAQRIAPLGLPLDRVRGLPLGAKQGAVLVGTGADVLDGFAPGSFLNLTDAEILNRKPFEDLPAGKLLTPAEPLPSDFPFVDETRTVEQIVIDMRSGKSTKHKDAAMIDLGPLSALAIAARAPPALSDPKPVLSARRESWGEIGTPQPQVYQSATAAHEFARIHGTVTVPVTDLTEPVALAGVL